MKSTALVICISLSLFTTAAVAAPAHETDYGLLGAPTASDTDANGLGGLPKTPKSDITIFRYLEVNTPSGLSDPHASLTDRGNRAVIFLGYQRALFYAAVRAAPQLVTSEDWKHVRFDEFKLIALTCVGQDRAAGRYGLTERQCGTWMKVNKSKLDALHRKAAGGN